MTARETMARWGRTLRAALLARLALTAAGSGAVVAAMAVALGFGPPVAIGLAAVAAAIVWAIEQHRVGTIHVTPERAALWVEEREPRFRYALVSAIEQAPPRDALERAVRAVDWEPAARARVRRSLRVPALVALAGVTTLALSPFARQLAARATATAAARASSGPGGTGGSLVPLSVTVTPPAYSRLASRTESSPSVVRALPGSRISFSGSGAGASLATVWRDSVPLAVVASGGGWNAAFVSDARRSLVRATRGGETRLTAIEPVVDSAPVVTLRLPARDTVLREGRGTLRLVADLHDDLALASASFEYVVSSGEGERFTFRSGVLAARRAIGSREAQLATTVTLDSLALSPGDVVHIRALARDANDVTGPGRGASDPRAIRIARAGEYDSIAVDAAPPAEADKSILSQRMLINLTEALVKRARTLARPQLAAESQRIGRDQERLRKQVSDVIFARLGDEPSGEHFHGDGHSHAEGDSAVDGPLTPAKLLAAAEAATNAAGNTLDFEHDETPVVAINRPLLEAYNAMWDAGRELSTAEPRRALPHMYAALAAIQRARSAERLYLRGARPAVVVDLAKVRMQGKQQGDPSSRTPRPSLDGDARQAAARFARAVELLGAAMSSAAAVDSLLVLRLDVVDRDASAALALEQAIGALRAGRDATALLVRARRALDHDFVARDSLPAWGGGR